MKKGNEEIHILGAGISGLTAAITLSDSFTVKVYERSTEVGESHSYISAIRNYEEEAFTHKALKMGIALKPSREIYAVHRYAPSGNVSTTLSNEPIFYIFERGKTQNSIERQLYEQALSKDVEVIFNSKKKNANIVATGPVRVKANIFGYGRIYEGEPDAVSLIYDNDYAPKGYICVLPSKTKFQVLAVSFAENVFQSLKKKFGKAIVQVPILTRIVKGCSAVREVEGYGNYFKPISYKNGMYYVGEAGGFQDPSRGFGIWYAILTGYLAAKSIIEKRDYNEKLRESVLEEYRINLKRRENFNRLTNQDFEKMIAKLGRKIDLRQYVERRV